MSASKRSKLVVKRIIWFKKVGLVSKMLLGKLFKFCHEALCVVSIGGETPVYLRTRTKNH
ncbi:hypothetical protein Pryu01_01977 [Paraliobacillus ryukyuensis]|uniref:Uncharacterized protein n=1 Tax=Paraliobacillus ryukyuensis TaxID=200904 RepID=A0A366E170_9BACI|nr:hypothetical protein DES48_10981 [Paraliobacillus ryukyuensis]